MSPAGRGRGAGFDYAGRVRRLRAALRAAQMAAILVSAPENIRYLSGFAEPYAAGERESSAALLITPRERLIFSDFRYRLQAEAQAPYFKFVEVTRGGPRAGAAAYAKKKGLEAAGYEASALTVEAMGRVRKASRGVKWVAARGLVEKQREVKEAAEIAEIKRAAEIADGAYLRMLDSLEPGLTEREVARTGARFILEEGGRQAAFEIIVASGPNGAMAHAVAGRRKIRRGDLVVFDLGVQMESGYCSDVTRTVAVGRAHRWQEEIYAVVFEAQRRGLEAVRAHRSGKEVDKEAREYIEECGYGEAFGHALGHGVGLAVHEEPRLAKRATEALRAGQVVTVEPGIYLAGRGGVRTEDLVVVKEWGCEVLSEAPKPKELPVI